MSRSQSAANLFCVLVDLARIRIVAMVLVACSIGFILAYRGVSFPFPRFFWTLIGTALLSGGACTLNCYLERESDALMLRTCLRPIPAGMIAPSTALGIGVSLVSIGCLLLLGKANVLSAILGLIAVFLYLAIYTPAKRMTWMNTPIGAIAGAVPPLIGWASARGQIEPGGWILLAMLFLWQHTHFLPIAWLYKGDYQRAGFRMLPVDEDKAEKTFRLTVITALALVPISMLLYIFDLTGTIYCLFATIFGVLLIVAGIRLYRQPSRPAAQFVLILSLWYFPVLLAALVLDRYGMQLGGHFHQWLGILCRWT
jgi:protoheme IX farnesyltransferase